ncbi:MAG TPA: ATP-binding protein, partial [Pyrinomonadaceae bacterium]|nr:ATP-binding protein [Pyrinomonadaceae bacterium]
QAVEAIAAALGAVAHGARAQEAPAKLVACLRRLASSGTDETADEDGVEGLVPADVARALGAHERRRLREAVGEGAHAYVVEADFDIATFDEQYRSLSDALGETCEIVSAQPFVETGTPERVGFRIVCASAESRDEVLAHLAPLGARLSEADDAVRDDETTHRDDETGEDEAGWRAPEPPPTKFVRVPLGELDKLVRAARSLFADALGALELALANSAAGDERSELESHAARTRLGLSEFEKRLAVLLATPLRATLARAARAGETFARDAGKSVEFETAGGEVLLDRSLVGGVAAALLHLVHNAVDHGIEEASERRAAGKDERGRVLIEALVEGERVVLRVSDDGRGVDAGRVARAAAARGLVAEGASVTDEEALGLIFRPGFSTAARATLASGRGVGLDVVERAVTEACGEVRVRTERGRGTVFEMRLPAARADDVSRPQEAAEKKGATEAESKAGATEDSTK